MERSKKVPTPTRKKKTRKVVGSTPQLLRLATSDLRRLAKPHVGFEAFVEPLIQLLDEFGDELGKASVDVDAMRESLATWKQLGPARDTAAEHLALVDNTRIAASSSVWTQMLVIYSHGKIAARTNARIRAALQAFEQFMSTGPRKSRATSPATT